MNLVGEPEDEGESGKENNCPDEKDRDRGMSEGEWWWTRILIKETRQKEAKAQFMRLAPLASPLRGYYKPQMHVLLKLIVSIYTL